MPQYRQSPFANLTPVVKNLLIINLICFLPFILFSESKYDHMIVENCGLFYFKSHYFRVWQLLSYMFFHGGWTHILFNMLALFMFGPILEYAIGPRKFFNLYFISGIGAAIFQMAVQTIEIHFATNNIVAAGGVITPDVYEKLQGIYNTPIIGASGAIFGVLVAFGMIYPDMELMILFFPVPVKAKYIIPVYILIEIWSTISPGPGDNVAHVAHLGGALVGFIMIKIWRYR